MKILIVARPVLGRLAPAALSGFSLAMLSPLSRPRHATFLPYLECTRLLAPSHSLSQCWFFCCSHVIFLCSLCLGIACPPLELAPLATSSPTWFISLVCTFQGSCASQFWFVTESQAYYDSWFMNPVSRAPATTNCSLRAGTAPALLTTVSPVSAFSGCFWLFIEGMKYVNLIRPS